MIQEVNSNALKIINSFKCFLDTGLAIVGDSLASQELADSWIGYLAEAFQRSDGCEDPVSLYDVPYGPE